MGCRVPDFVTEEDNPPVFPRKIPDLVGEDFVELVWQKGPFFQRRSPDLHHADPAIPCRTEPYAACGVAFHTAAAAAPAPMPSTELFMEEDEMSSWLYYPLGGDDDDPGGRGVNPTDQLREAADVAGPEQGFPAAAADLKVEADVWASPGRPPLHPETRGRSAGLAAPLPLPAWGDTSTVVDSSATTEPGGRTRRGAESRVSSGDVRGAPAPCEHGPASSSGLSWEGEEEGEAAAMAAGRGDNRKRKAREDDDRCDSHSEDADFETGGKRRDVRRSASARRARAAEVHNLSERRRRDRINEKMKALQQLIPRCHKSDKASMLDDAIEYMKSLQMQVQMMSRCCNMAPMMFPGVQQYMQSMGMGIPVGMMNMGMGVGMATASGGLSHPMMPFPTVMLGARMAANGAPHLSQRLPLQPVHAPGAALAGQMRLQGTSQADAASSSVCITTPSTVQMPNQLAGVRPQSRAITEPGSSKGTSMTEKSKLG